jgi:hypothetical protein
VITQAGYVAKRALDGPLRLATRIVSCRATMALITSDERGEVLPLTMQLPAAFPVLVGGVPALERVLARQTTADRILWFREGSKGGEPLVRETLAAHGYVLRPLRSAHPGVHDVLLATRPSAAMAAPLCEGHR